MVQLWSTSVITGYYHFPLFNRNHYVGYIKQFNSTNNLKKCGVDPATSSAPFVATFVDVTGLIIYFSNAAIFLKGTLL